MRTSHFLFQTAKLPSHVNSDVPDVFRQQTGDFASLTCVSIIRQLRTTLRCCLSLLSGIIGDTSFHEYKM
jgi:hypothetical protein